LTAASATFALKAGVWFRRARLVIVSPDSRDNLVRRQAETPLIALCRFPEPALTLSDATGVDAISLTIIILIVPHQQESSGNFEHGRWLSLR
jgi:hypothetical protein